jgi:hypothetical protein
VNSEFDRKTKTTIEYREGTPEKEMGEVALEAPNEKERRRMANEAAKGAE